MSWKFSLQRWQSMNIVIVICYKFRLHKWQSMKQRWQSMNEGKIIFTICKFRLQRWQRKNVGKVIVIGSKLGSRDDKGYCSMCILEMTDMAHWIELYTFNKLVAVNWYVTLIQGLFGMVAECHIVERRIDRCGKQTVQEKRERGINPTSHQEMQVSIGRCEMWTYW